MTRSAGQNVIRLLFGMTSTDSIVLNFVRELRGLLRQLDRINSINNTEAESMKGKVTGSVNKVLEDIENEVEGVIGKWVSLQPTGSEKSSS